ncbi:MAG: Aspartokinase [Chlamydiales bacterium]|nr:Aspartokinase [Chlamydiales bacterium]MCH9620263.1 Aspartokinase [Chlamydiales bacterium]MCH9622827.1 Aspartokinase [Chlamydiales bacterium]
MPDQDKTLIMKFGGGVLTSESFHRIADIIIQKKLVFGQIGVVVSAMRGVTNQLIALAKSVHPNPPRREYDMLVSVGERVSISLLAMALQNRGIEAVSFTGSQSGVITTDDHSSATIIDVRPTRLIAPLKEGKIVIVAGFQGVSQSKEITTLGRGGSDTTAVALGGALGADEVLFYKDVAGICPLDPKKDPTTKPFEHLSYLEALDLIHKTGNVIHPMAVEWAKKDKIPLRLSPFWDDHEKGTVIS